MKKITRVYQLDFQKFKMKKEAEYALKKREKELAEYTRKLFENAMH